MHRKCDLIDIAKKATSPFDIFQSKNRSLVKLKLRKLSTWKAPEMARARERQFSFSPAIQAQWFSQEDTRWDVGYDKNKTQKKGKMGYLQGPAGVKRGQ